MFDNSDKNGNGVLELEEFKQFTLNLLEAISDHPLGQDKESVRDLYERLDKNKDGVLQWSEVWDSFKNAQEKYTKK
jgi:Ca2+-binding EF-hand superfamily protein